LTLSGIVSALEATSTPSDVEIGLQSLGL